ncbi:MAG: AAA family ATPase [bacterium]|jgi:lon-related putative ATP-dependent protease
MARTLNPEDLRKLCDPKRFRFASTSEIAPLTRIVGQARALDAIDFGLDMRSLGFNIYALGEGGTGKTSAIRSFVSEKAKAEPVPPDRAYVFNFRDPEEPIALSLTPGRGAEFQRDMREMVDYLRSAIPKVFDSKEYEVQKGRIVEGFQKRQKEIFGLLEEEAKSTGFTVRPMISGFSIVAVDEAGEPLTEEKFNTLDEAKKREVRDHGKRIQERLDDVVRTVKTEERVAKEELAELERNAALSVLGHRLEELRKKHEGNEKLLSYLDAVQEAVLASIEDFKSGGEETPSPLPFLRIGRQEPDFSRYSVNVIVNNGGTTGAPCVFESNPTYYNLFGRIEHRFQMGAALTDFTMIKCGSLHKANGGFLVINALDLLRNIFSYDALKRAIRNREVKIEDVWEQYRLVTTTAMKPEPIPLDVKVVLIGNPEIYYLLYNLDEEYRELFKVKADFDHRIDRTEESVDHYSAFVATKAKDEALMPFTPEGVARVVDFGSRLAEDQEKLSTKFSDISNLLKEANYWAKREGATAVTADHVSRALRAKIRRNSRIEEQMRELAAQGTLIVDTAGEQTGQVNGLAVYDMGDYSFGKPSRITATVYAGKGGVLNIERETKLSGKIHEKAVLILSNYLGRRFARNAPISLSASITFEQLYGMIEGDSATCAELYALLSALAGVPIRQGIAVTGSMDQNGAVQPIGGVNEKIEGFFDLCKLRGLDGSQGVLVPARNRRNLVLKDEVVQAVREGTFRVFEIDRVEEGIDTLMGLPAGELGPDGNYPPGTLYRKVMDRIGELREAVKGEEREEEKGKKEREE